MNPHASHAEAADGELSGVPEAESAPKEPDPEVHAGAVLRAIWPTVAGLFFSGTCGLLIFPFLTYVPSDGMLGELLPKVGRDAGLLSGVRRLSHECGLLIMFVSHPRACWPWHCRGWRDSHITDSGVHLADALFFESSYDCCASVPQYAVR